jgi:glycosyltransferase A (GT-A) superfamily protein (DUF2064 family)
LDTLEVVGNTAAARRVLVFDGDPGHFRREGLEVIPQRGDGLAERLAAAFEDVRGPALLVGMDTPQLTPSLLSDGMRALAAPAIDAVLGPADDGGYWSVGLKHHAGLAFADIPMSSSSTCAAQRARLRELGLRVHDQPRLRDVDTMDDARAVASEADGTRFAAAVDAIVAYAIAA